MLSGSFPQLCTAVLSTLLQFAGFSGPEDIKAAVLSGSERLGVDHLALLLQVRGLALFQRCMGCCALPAARLQASNGQTAVPCCCWADAAHRNALPALLAPFICADRTHHGRGQGAQDVPWPFCRALASGAVSAGHGQRAAPSQQGGSAGVVWCVHTQTVLTLLAEVGKDWLCLTGCVMVL